MTTYAIGKKNKKVRMFVQADDLSIIQAQLAFGEVFVEVEAAMDGKISSNGLSFIPAGVDMNVERCRIREYRAGLLSACDWTQFPDAPLTLGKKLEWQTYRQALRDITETYPNALLSEVVWPEAPAR